MKNIQFQKNTNLYKRHTRISSMVRIKFILNLYFFQITKTKIITQKNNQYVFLDKSNNINISNQIYYKDSSNILRISLIKNKNPTKNENNSLTKNKKDDEDIEMKDEINNKNMNKNEKENVNININKNNNLNITDNNIKDYNSKDRLITENNKININFVKIKNDNKINIEVIDNKNQLKEEENNSINTIKELKVNIQNVKEYIDDILQNLIEEEKNQIYINPNYFQYQYEINPNMRSILIDWIININYQFKFKEETLYTAIYIIDAYLSKKYIKQNNLQLLGVSSLLIASKINEIYLRRISDFSEITNKTYNEQEIKSMELDILKTLNFDLLVPSPLSFYEIIIQKKGVSFDLSKFKFGEFLMQSFLINSNSLYYTSSTIACAACYIVMKFCKIQNYRNIFDNKFINIKKDLYNYTGNKTTEYIIKDCAKKICETINALIKSNLKSTINKYSDNFFYNEIKNNCNYQ